MRNHAMNQDSSPLSIEELESRMRPGRFSQAGFLGSNESLSAVLAQDAEILLGLRLSFTELSERLEKLIEAAETNTGRSIRVAPHFTVSVRKYTGFQICPWSLDPHHMQCTEGGGVRHASIDWEIRNLRTGQQMQGPGLIVHLIRDHHFFEGLESPHRVDPNALAQLLELGLYSNE
jgi:hypothetical protein